MGVHPRDEGSFRELATDLLAGAFPDADKASLQQEAQDASVELAKPGKISSELDRLASFAAPRHTRQSSAGIEGGLEEQVEPARAGDREALTKLLSQIYPIVVRYCRSRLDHTDINPEDVAQEICLAVLTRLPTYRVSGSPFLAFVFGISAEKVADAHRAAARNRADPLSDTPEEPVQVGGPEQRTLQAELAGRMGRLVDTLPDKQREVLILRVVVGLSVEETAEAVGSTPGGVRVAQHRALTRLQKILASEEVA